MSRDFYFLILAGVAGFLGGVWLRSLIFLDWWAILLFILVALILFFARAPRVAVVFLIFVAFGVGRFHWADARLGSLDNYLGQTVTLSGVITAPPKVSDRSQQIIIRPRGSAARAGRILALAPLYPTFQYGDEVRITGVLARPENFLTATGKEFDYLAYLATSGIHYQLRGFTVTAELLTPDQGFYLLAQLFHLQTGFLTALTRLLPEPEASLGAGITIGAKTSLDKQTADNFRRAGLSHIVVLSGYNITVVASLVLTLLSRLPRFLGLGTGAVMIILFTLMTGASATAVRAALMALVAILARSTGRIYQAAIALLTAAVIMVLVNPRLLVFDIGFQLSFLATLGLIYLTPIFKLRLTWLTEKFTLRETLATTLGAQLMVTPWILYKMGNLSLVALPANLLVLPLVPPAMLLAGLAGLGGMISVLVATPIGYLAYLPLVYMIKLTGWFANLPLAMVTVNQVPLVLVGLAYLGLLWLIIRSKDYAKKSLCVNKNQ